MKRTILTLAALTAVAVAAPANAALPSVKTRTVYCGTTVLTPCGYCVSVNVVENCTTW